MSINLIGIILHRGNEDQIAFLPVCSRCGDVIFDLRNANFEITSDECIPLPNADNVSAMPEVSAYCPKCIHRNAHAWLPASTVIKENQSIP